MAKDMHNKEPIEVDIRPWAKGDLPLLQRLMGDPLLTEHIGGPETQEQILNRHRRYCINSGPGKNSMFAIVVGLEQLAVGSIGYWEKEWQGQLIWETGWIVLSDFQGKGITTQATRKLLDWARTENKHRYIHAFPSPDNGPSNAICRKMGFTLLGVVDFEYPKGVFEPSNDWCLDLFAGYQNLPSIETPTI